MGDFRALKFALASSHLIRPLLPPLKEACGKGASEWTLEQIHTEGDWKVRFRKVGSGHLGEARWLRAVFSSSAALKFLYKEPVFLS